MCEEVANYRAKNPRERARDHIVAHDAKPAFDVAVDFADDAGFSDVKQAEKGKRKRGREQTPAAHADS